MLIKPFRTQTAIRFISICNYVTSGQTNLDCWTIKGTCRPSAGTVKATDQTALMKTSSLNRYDTAKYSYEQRVWRARLIYGKTLTTAGHQSGINKARTQQGMNALYWRHLKTQHRWAFFVLLLDKNASLNMPTVKHLRQNCRTYRLWACLPTWRPAWFCLVAFGRDKPDARSWWICQSAAPRTQRERTSFVAPSPFILLGS